MKYIKGLDTLRAFAVLFVMLHHFRPEINHIKPLYALLKIPDGYFGVDLFFVLSGFLITSVLLEAKENSGYSALKIIRNFMIRRILRLFPVYYLLLLVLYFIDYPDVRSNIVYFATYTSNFLVLSEQSWNQLSHTWSLSVEEQFYFIWPFIMIFCPRKHLVNFVFFFIFLGTVSSLLTSYVISPYFGQLFGPYFPVFTFNCFHAFAIGALFSLSRLDGLLNIWVPRIFFYLLPISLFLYVVHRINFYLHIDVSYVSRLVNSVLAINLIIYVVRGNYSKLAGKIVNNRLLINLGKISYGVYLYHYVVAVLCKERWDPRVNGNSLFPNQYVYTLFLFAATITLAYLSYHLLEKHFLNLKKYFGTTNLKASLHPVSRLGQTVESFRNKRKVEQL